MRRAILGGGEGQEADEHERAAGHPPAPVRVALRKARPAECAGAAEHAQDGGREEGVARVDGQAGRREDGEHEDHHHTGARPQQRAPA